MNIDTSKVELVSIALADKIGNHVGQAYVYKQDSNYVLAWNDGMVNEWKEVFADLGLAMARLSVLHYAVGQDKFFANTPHDFTERANDFLKGQIVGMD